MPKPPPTDDDEFEARARRNLSAGEDRDTAADIGTDGAGIGHVLAELDELLATPEDRPLAGPGLLELEAALAEASDKERRRKVVADAVSRFGPGSPFAQAAYERYAASLAARQRAEYRDKILVEKGRAVRARLLRPEDRQARRAEQERLRYAAKKGGEVRRYKALADMSPEDRAAYKTEQARLRQERRRAKKRMKKMESIDE